jgi:hypothetical protein
VQLLLYCDVIFSKVWFRVRLRLAYNFCARYVFGICRSDHISGYSARILGFQDMLPDAQEIVYSKTRLSLSGVEVWLLGINRNLTMN